MIGPVSRSNPLAVDQAITGADFLQLDRAAAPAGGLTDWLTGQLRRAIADGRLPVGARLPASRVLADELRVSRGVVTEAYQRLAEDGHLAGRGRAGTRVLAAPAAIPALGRASRTEPGGVGRAGAKSPGSGAAAGQPAAERAAFAAAPGTEVYEEFRGAACRIDLFPGLPDLTAFPRGAWLRAERSVLGRLAPSSFSYGDPRGALAFRTAVASWLARNRGIVAEPEQVIVVAGVAQALALLARTLHRAGLDAVAVEDPGSLGSRLQLRNWGLDTPPIPVDDRGLRVAELRASGAPAVMLTPAHQFPTGVVLDGERRRELREWAGDGGLIIEDDYDAEHRYDRPPVPALRSVLPEQVCYTGSVSKLLAPALRCGWLLVPPGYYDAVVAAKRDADLGNAVLPQLVLAELMESGELERHLRLLRKRHIRRRDAMIEAIRAHLPQARIHGAAAGLHLTLTFDDAPQGTALADAALAQAALDCGVKVQPLSWHSQRPAQPGLVLGYAASSPAEISEGIAIVGSILHRQRRESARPARLCRMALLALGSISFMHSA
jgi:GntR family transcriptional regulator / MocR family aminotransferase